MPLGGSSWRLQISGDKSLAIKPWNKESALEAAKHFKKRSEFAKKNAAAYDYAAREGILDEVCDHMRKQPRSWDKTSVLEVARQFKTRGEFAKHGKNAYMHAHRHGFLAEVCGHMQSFQKYSDQQLLQEALKYSRRIDFQKGSKNLYNTAHRRGLLDRICSHMLAMHMWDIRQVRELAGSYHRRSDFSKAQRGAYKWASKNGVLDQVFSHIPEKKRAKWDKSSVIALAIDCGTLVDLRKASKAAINAAMLDGYWQEVLDLFPDSGWYPEAIIEEARKYNSRSAFARGSIGAYRATLRLGLEEKVFNHMQDLIHHYSDQDLFDLAKRYKSRTDLVFDLPGASDAARKRGIWDQICEHMGPAKSGFREDKPAVLYLLVDSNISRINLGITGRFKARLATHNLNDRADYQVLRLIEFGEGETPRVAERLILEGIRAKGIEPLDGTREEFLDIHLIAIQTLFDEVVDAAK